MALFFFFVGSHLTPTILPVTMLTSSTMMCCLELVCAVVVINSDAFSCIRGGWF